MTRCSRFLQFDMLYFIWNYFKQYFFPPVVLVCGLILIETIFAVFIYTMSLFVTPQDYLSLINIYENIIKHLFN